MSLPASEIAAPLYTAIGPDAFAHVARWLQDVAADCALETRDGRVIAPNVAWLADAVTFYDPAATT